MDSTIFKISLCLLLSGVLTSCSFLDRFMNERPDGQTKISSAFETKTCLVAEQAIIGQSNELANDFQKFLKILTERKIRTSFVDRAVMWSLLQGMAHPQLASYSARLSFMMQEPSTPPYYLDIITPDDNAQTFPVLHGLTLLLREKNSKHNLASLAQLIDLYFPRQVIVEKSLQQFVEQNKKSLRNDSQLRPFYFRGKQVLKKDETVGLKSLLPFIKKNQSLVQKSENYSKDQTLHLFHAKRMDATILCNYDLNLYHHGVYLNTPSIVDALPMAYQERDKVFLASFSQDTSSFTSLGQGHQIRGISKKGLRPAFCTLEKNGFKMLILSNKDRDPAQFIFNLIEKQHMSFNPTDISLALSQGRSLMLLNPLRTILESDIMPEYEIDDLNKNKMALYHASALGDITLSYTDQQQNLSLFADGRNNNTIKCALKKAKDTSKTE